MSTQLAIRPIAEITAEANRYYTLAQTHAENAVEYAMRCGEELVQLKAQLDHGQWLPWIERNFHASEWTARNYMRIASNRERVPDSSIRAALKTLAATEPQPKTSTREIAHDLKELGATGHVDSTAHEENEDPMLIGLEDAFGRVVGLLAAARALNGSSAIDKQWDALDLALQTTRSLKAYLETHE